MESIKIILEETRKWNLVPDSEDSDPTPAVPVDTTDHLEGAGKTLDALLCSGMGKEIPPSDSFGHMDPRTILTLKSHSAKAVHITLFLTEQSKRCRQSK